jgi:glycosyltransferase involved in cell wall biosynthesis
VGDIERLADGILAFYQKPELGLEYGQRGYAQIVAKYSQEMIATQMAQVFQRVIEGRNNP